MALSARNQISGTIASVVRGPVTSLIKIDIGGGKDVTASVTTDAFDEMRLVVGTEVKAVFKASSVMIAIED